MATSPRASSKDDPDTEGLYQDIAAPKLGWDGFGSMNSFLVKCDVPGYGKLNLFMTSLDSNSSRLRLRYIKVPPEASKPLTPVSTKLGFCFWLWVLEEILGTVGG